MGLKQETKVGLDECFKALHSRSLVCSLMSSLRALTASSELKSRPTASQIRGKLDAQVSTQLGELLPGAAPALHQH